MERWLEGWKQRPGPPGAHGPSPPPTDIGKPHLTALALGSMQTSLWLWSICLACSPYHFIHKGSGLPQIQSECLREKALDQAVEAGTDTVWLLRNSPLSGFPCGHPFSWMPALDPSVKQATFHLVLVSPACLPAEILLIVSATLSPLSHTALLCHVSGEHKQNLY